MADRAITFDEIPVPEPEKPKRKSKYVPKRKAVAAEIVGLIPTDPVPEPSYWAIPTPPSYVLGWKTGDGSSGCVECGKESSFKFQTASHLDVPGWTDVTWCSKHIPVVQEMTSEGVILRRFSGKDSLLVKSDGSALRRQDGRVTEYTRYGELIVGASMWPGEIV